MVFALLLKSMTKPIVSAVLNARPTKFGTLPFVPADVYLATISLEECAASVTLRLKSMTRKTNAVTVLKDTEKQVVKVAMEFAHPSVLLTRTGSLTDASANQDTS